MSHAFKRLSKRASMWESTFTLPNYTRPQGWAVIEPGDKLQAGPDDVQGLIEDVLYKEFGGISLDSADMDECIEFVSKMSVGYGLSYNKLKRMIGMWLSSYQHQPQIDSNQNYQEIGFN